MFNHTFYVFMIYFTIGYLTNYVFTHNFVVFTHTNSLVMSDHGIGNLTNCVFTHNFIVFNHTNCLVMSYFGLLNNAFVVDNHGITKLLRAIYLNMAVLFLSFDVKIITHYIQILSFLP